MRNGYVKAQTCPWAWVSHGRRNGKFLPEPNSCDQKHWHACLKKCKQEAENNLGALALPCSPVHTTLSILLIVAWCALTAISSTQGCGVARSRRFLGGDEFLRTLNCFLTPTPEVQLNHLLHRTPKLGILVVLVQMAQLILKLLLKQRFLAVYPDFHWLLVAKNGRQLNFLHVILRSHSRKFWKGRSWSLTSYLRHRNPAYTHIKEYMTFRSEPFRSRDISVATFLYKRKWWNLLTLLR